MVALVYIVQPILSALFRGDATVVLGWRLFIVAGWAAQIVLLVRLGWLHFRHLILTGKDLRVKSLAFFYIAGTVFFAGVHRSLYYAHPDLYSYPNAPAMLPLEISQPRLPHLSTTMDFFVYSWCVALTLQNPRIASASTAVSAIEIAEALLSLVTFGLVLSSLVQRLRPARRDSQRDNAD